MRRPTAFDLAWYAWLLSLTACDSLCPGPSLDPDECFTSTFDYRAYPYTEMEGGPDCTDPDERNEDLTQAAAPSSPMCTGEHTGHIDGPNDVDVFRTGECVGSRFTNLPTAVNVHADLPQKRDDTADDNLRFCIFPMCEEGATNLQTCTGNSDARHDDASDSDVSTVYPSSTGSGFIGCCRIGPGTLDASFFCPGRARDVDTYFWLDGGELPLANTCSPYYFTYDVEVD